MHNLLLAHLLPSPWLLATHWWDVDFWYALPLILAISLVYAATRHEAMEPLLRHAARVGGWIIGLMAAVGLVLWFILLWV
jgi:hypothetical protein